tara:strand:- start:46 stop:300 length:255 start_codon:yes stop_codon:yes gene_type:complete
MINNFKILNACKKIYPNAEVSIKGEDFSTIKFYNGTPTMTEAEIKAKFSEVEADEQAAIDKKASGKQKLKDLGLTDDEIQALIG